MRSAIVAFIQRLERISNLANHLHRKKVVGRTLNFNGGDKVVDIYCDGFEGVE